MVERPTPDGPPQDTPDGPPQDTPAAPPATPGATGGVTPPPDEATWRDMPTGPLPAQYQTGPTQAPPTGGAAPPLGPGAPPPPGAVPAGGPPPAEGPPRALWVALALVLAGIALVMVVVLARTTGWARPGVPAVTPTTPAQPFATPTFAALVPPTEVPTPLPPSPVPPTTAPTAAATLAPPVALIDAPPLARVGQPVPFSGAGSTSGAAITGYSWDFGDGAKSRGSDVEHAFAAAGTYPVQLVITDSAGRAARAATSIQIEASPQRPPAAVLVGPPTGLVGQGLTFDASSSQPGTAAITRYGWQFGDGATSQGMTVSHAFARPGTYQVALTVTDANGLTDDATLDVVIAAPAPPEAVIQAPERAKVGDTLTFDGSGSGSGSPIVAYQWRFGDGGGTDAVVARYAYGEADTYQVTLTIVDSTGARDTATHSLVIEPAATGAGPKAAITGPARAAAGQTATYSATGSKPGDSPIASYDWVLGGTGGRGAGSGPSFSYTFPTPGSYVVTLIVTDGAGRADAASLTVTVGRGR